MWVNKLYQKSGKRKYEMSEWKYEVVINIKSKYVFLQFLYMKNERDGCS